MSAELSPRVRAAVSIVAAIGVFICDKPLLQLACWLVLVGILIYTRALRKHLQFASIILLTIGIPLSVVWVGIRNASPYTATGVHDRQAAITYVLVVLLRLINISGITLACFTPISGDRLAPTLRAWGLRNNAFLIALSSMFVGADLARCADQVLTARLARGFVVRRSRWAMVKQLPHILQPLLIRALRSATDRADLWKQRQLLKHLSMVPVDASRYGPVDALAGALAVAWVVVAVISRGMA